MAVSTFWTPNFTWRGEFADESDSDAHVRAVADVVVFGGQARWVTAYTARTPDEFRWSLLFDTDYLLSQLPPGATGQYLGWTGTTWAPVSVPQFTTQALTFAAALSMNVASGYVGTVTLTGNTVFTITGGHRRRCCRPACHPGHHWQPDSDTGHRRETVRWPGCSGSDGRRQRHRLASVQGGLQATGTSWASGELRRCSRSCWNTTRPNVHSAARYPTSPARGTTAAGYCTCRSS